MPSNLSCATVYDTGIALTSPENAVYSRFHEYNALRYSFVY